MPIFEFECSLCRTRFEKILKSPAESAPCPRCSGEGRRTISAPAATPSGSSTSTGCSGGGFT